MIKDLLIDLERLETIGEIGQGSFGIVYLVNEIETGKQYAAKVRREECVTTQEQIQFFQEITIYSKVKNPAVLSLFGFNMMNFQNEHYPTIITEYMANGSLDQILKNAQFPISKKYIILLGIAEGMKYLHSQNIIHCDLKPGNILLDQNFYPHICDFGESEISQLSISSVKIESCRGTPAYMAPEVFSEEQCTYKIDVFSFSFIAFELLTGIKPFSNYRSIFRLQNDIKNNKRPDLSTIKDEEIRKFLQKCWSSNPNDRPTFCEIVDEIKRFNFRKMMKANEKEVIEYLRLFGEDIKIQHKKDQQLLFIKQKQKQQIHDENNTKKINLKSFFYEENENENENKNNKNLFILANKLRNGDGIEINKGEAARLYKKLADLGNIESMFNYASMLKNGEGIKMDKNESFRYFKMSAERNHVESMLILSRMLQKGEGTKMNKDDSIRYLKMAADEGNDIAMNHYAFILSNGEGIETNKEEAAHYFKLAADKGNESAMNHYAVLLYNGEGIEMNKEKAAHYFKMAADKGNEKAMFNYAHILKYGDGISINKGEYIRYLKMAADFGNDIAMDKFGCLLYHGEEIEMNKVEAARYFKLAADKGNVKSINKFACMLEYGDGIPIDKIEAARYYKMSADKGNKIAMSRYARMLNNGDGIEQNKDEAARYFKLSSEKGSKNVIRNY